MRDQHVRFCCLAAVAFAATATDSFVFGGGSLLNDSTRRDGMILEATNGFRGGGSGAGFGSSGSSAGTTTKKNKKKSKKQVKGKRLVETLEDWPKSKDTNTASDAGSPRPHVKSEQNDFIETMVAQSSKTCIGRAVAETKQALLQKGQTDMVDSFWDLMPSLISSRFPNAADKELGRVAGMVQYALDATSVTLEPSLVNDPWRPHDEIHAYMPGLGETQPFLDPSRLAICQQLSDNYSIILEEYGALLKDKKDRFQSVTSMNYESGWKTLVLFYNGHRIPDFPYHLCPTTTKLLEQLPLAGRIAGFNRQAPSSGIPLHTDGNNMWLTCQMGMRVPPGDKAWIRVGPETRRWKQAECLVYDTTYEHETMNEHPTEERVVLHVDFFNTLKLTPTEIEVMQYIYSLREEFMKAEGVAKVGKQIL